MAGIVLIVACMDIFSVLVASFLVVNVTAFLIMFLDKSRSRTVGSERISEGMLFFLATAFGSVGVYVGMFLFRHKTKKWYFVVGIPLLAAENAAFLYLVYTFLRGGA